MNKNLKIGLTLLIIASVVFLCTTVAFFVLKSAETQKRIFVEAQLEKINIAKAALAEDIEELRKKNAQLEGKILTASEEAKRISRELASEKESKLALARELEDERKKSDGFIDDIMKEKEERLGLVHKLSRAEDEYQQLREEYDILLQAKEALEKKVKSVMAKKGVELERIEVRRGYRIDEEPVIEELPEEVITETIDNKRGSVLVVNKKFNFIVANIGLSDGLATGAVLNIYRDGALIARGRVEKLYDTMSAATMLPQYKAAAVRVKDQVYISQ